MYYNFAKLILGRDPRVTNQQRLNLECKYKNPIALRHGPLVNHKYLDRAREISRTPPKLSVLQGSRGGAVRGSGTSRVPKLWWFVPSSHPLIATGYLPYQLLLADDG